MTGTGTWTLYGANGYSGEMLARLAVERGERPILAGRNAQRLAPLAAELGLDWRAVDLRDASGLRGALDFSDTVAHCAGPYAQTAAPMIAACLDTATNYLDITGELGVYEWIFDQHAAAERAGVVLLTGAGFDVVPTDCLAAGLAAQLPGATGLEIAFLAPGGMSRGTARTAVAEAAAGACRRVDGRLVPTPFGPPRRLVPFPSGERMVGATRWGDVVTAYRSTGIPNITVYTVLPARAGSPALRLLRAPLVRRLARALVRPGGPDAERRDRTGCEVWAEVRDDAGNARTATLTGPNAYALTADAMLRAVQRIRAGGVPAGAHTPSSALGADFVRQLDGVTVS